MRSGDHSVGADLISSAVGNPWIGELSSYDATGGPAVGAPRCTA
jgi:hypothetical protein